MNKIKNCDAQICQKPEHLWFTAYYAAAKTYIENMMLLLYFYFGNLYHSYLKCLDKRFEELTVESQVTSNNIIFAPMVP